MKQFLVLSVSLAILFFGIQGTSSAQVRWGVGGNTGLALATSPSSADFIFGPSAEVLFGKGPAVGTEFNIFTATGTPIEWATYFKYYFTIPGSKVKPFVDSGFGIVFVSGGPFFDIRFGGGANFEVGRNIYIVSDLQFGPIFTSGTTQFNILIRGGIQYVVP